MRFARSRKQTSWALGALMIFAQGAQAQQKSPEKQQQNEMQSLGFKLTQTLATGKQLQRMPWDADSKSGTSAFRGCTIKENAKDLKCDKTVFLITRRILGREDSFLALLMVPNKDQEKIVMYRIDPIKPGFYDMTRISLTKSDVVTGSYLGVDGRVDPELTLTLVGETIRINKADHLAPDVSALFGGFKAPIIFNGPSFFKPVPDAEWDDLASGRYKGEWFSGVTSRSDDITIAAMDPTSNRDSEHCSKDEPCWETTASFTVTSQEKIGDRVVYGRYPGMFTFNYVDTRRDGQHVGSADYVGVFIKLNGQRKLYLVNPRDASNVSRYRKVD